MAAPGLQPCGLLQLINDFLLLDFVAMKFKAGSTEANPIKPSLNNLQSSLLLRDKKNFLAGGQSTCNQVDDGLRLSRSWWSLNNHVEPARYVQDREGLGAVCVHDMGRVGNRNMVIDERVIGER